MLGLRDQGQISALVQHPKNFVGIMSEVESISSRNLQLGSAKCQHWKESGVHLVPLL